MVSDGDTGTGRGRRVRRRAGGALSCRRRLADVLLPLALLGAPSPALAANPVDIAAAVGFTDTFHPGRWTPLSVTVTNRGGDVTGELEVQVTGGDALRGRQFVTSHLRSLELHRDSRKTLQFVVLPQGLAHPLVIRVRSAGRELARTEIDLRTRFIAERIVLVLSRDANLDSLNDKAANGLRVVYPHPELLPAHWRGYDAVSAVVVHGVSLERLSASQFEALHKWIAQGGILAVSGGPDYALLRSQRLASLLPGVPTGLTRVDAGALRRAFSASLDVSRPIHVNRLADFRGHARLRAGDVPLIVERTLGLGRVLYLTFDVAGHPFDHWDGLRGLLLESLRLPPPAGIHLSADEPSVESPLPSLIGAEATDFPTNATVFYFLALYAGLLLAAHCLSVRVAWAPWLAALRNWGAPVLCAPVAWLLFGPAAFPRDATVVTGAVIEPFPGSVYARLLLDLGVYATRNGALRLEYRGSEPVLYPPRQARRDGNVEDWTIGEGPRRFVEPADGRRYVLHALEGEDVIAFHLEASVRDEAGALRLVLDNASGHALEDLWLVSEGYGYEIGSVAAGARLERGFVPRTHGVTVGGDSWRVLRPLAGESSQLKSPAQVVLERRAQAMGKSGYPAPGHALLLGYTASPLQPAGDSAAWPRRERALLAFQVAVTPGDASAGRTGTGPLEPGDDDAGRTGSPRMHGAAAQAAVR
jgi:hypothetical protein